MKEQKNPDSPP